VTNLTKRQSCIAIFAGILVLYTAGATRAQTPTPRPTGEFLCSAGTRDGVACNSDDDCPGGVCVIAQGVCDGGDDDGFPCDCAAGSCNAQPVCSDDATLGTCGSGVSAGECCDVTTNCAGGVTCRGTQKVCLAGDSKGFSCVNDQQCPSSVCRSTGKFCDGGDFDGFSCVDNSDCPNSTGGRGTDCNCHAHLGNDDRHTHADPDGDVAHGRPDDVHPDGDANRNHGDSLGNADADGHGTDSGGASDEHPTTGWYPSHLHFRRRWLRADAAERRQQPGTLDRCRPDGALDAQTPAALDPKIAAARRS